MPWFVATVVERITVEDDPRVVVHLNVHLVEARDAKETRRKAMRLGRTPPYDNPDGKRVVFRNIGLRSLVPVYDGEIVDGVEIGWRQKVVASLAAAHAFVRPARLLEAYRKPEAHFDPSVPNYCDGAIWRQLVEATEAGKLRPPASVRVRHRR